MMGMPRDGNRRLRIATALVLACAAAAAIAIFVLTEQSPEDTSAESSFVNDVLAGLLGGIPGLYDPETKLWLGLRVRHWAHTVEFGVLGLFVASAVALLRWRKPLIPSAAISLAVCLCFSLFDQFHKLFVSGRHFDGFDLVMDALGYGLAIVVVAAVATVVEKRRAWKR